MRVLEGTFDHHLNNLDEARVLLSEIQETLCEQSNKVTVAVRIKTAHKLNVLVGELEGRLLKPPPARREA